MSVFDHHSVLKSKLIELDKAKVKLCLLKFEITLNCLLFSTQTNNFLIGHKPTHVARP